MSSINIHYFALLREKSNKDQESLTTLSKTYEELYEELSEKYNFSLPASMIQVAVNDEFISMRDLIQDNSKVVFIPPVAGG
jgi:sulfur-carrier protein